MWWLGWSPVSFHHNVGVQRHFQKQNVGRSRVGLLSKACRRHHVQQQKLQNNRSEPEHNGSTFVGSTEQPVAVGPTEQPMVNFENDLMQKVIALMAKKKEIEERFAQSSAMIDVATFASVQGFPVDASGAVKFADSCTKNRLSRKLDDFFVYDRLYNDCRARRVWPVIIGQAYPWMAHWTLKDQLLALIARTLHNRSKKLVWLDVVEYFAGRGNLSRAALSKGLSVCSLDNEFSSLHDVLDCPDALRLWFSVLAATKPNCLVWHGTPCSSFSIMCRSTSERNATNSFLGNECKTFVLQGNYMADLTALTLLLAHLMECKEALEQSGTSVMPQAPSVYGVLAFIRAFQVITYHACFGSPTMKPFQLWSSSTFISDLARRKPNPSEVGHNSWL